MSAQRVLVDGAARFEVVDLDLARGLAAAAFHDVGQVDHARIEAGGGRELALVRGARNAVPLVEAAVRGVAAFDVAEMPFAVVRGGIAA